MTVTHRVVGYDRNTEWVAAEYDVPPERFDTIRRVVHIPATDQDAVGNYPLDAPTAQEVGKIIGAPIDTKRMDYFLEPAP